MNRKQFVKGLGLSALALQNFSLLNVFAAPVHIPVGRRAVTIPPVIEQAFSVLVDWLERSRWNSFLEAILQLPLPKNTSDPGWSNSLPRLEKIREQPGFEDFAGDQLIRPGNPSMSLLYHALASPRVKGVVEEKKMVTDFPGLEELDALENYIYACQEWDDTNYKKENLHLMVLSYEYRPAYKVPTMDLGDKKFPKYAGIVYSRTGVARIGTEPFHYDSESRSFTNLPEDAGKKKNIAVTAARYGLFLVELVILEQEVSDPIVLMNYQANERTNLGERGFIRPLRKIFNDGQLSIRFAEYHLNEKLSRLARFEYLGQKIEFFPKQHAGFLDEIPFKRVSATDDTGSKLGLYKNDRKMVELLRNNLRLILRLLGDWCHAENRRSPFTPVSAGLYQIAGQIYGCLYFYLDSIGKIKLPACDGA